MKRKIYILLFLFPFISYKSVSSMDIFQRDLKKRKKTDINYDDELLGWTHDAYTDDDMAFVRGQALPSEKSFFMSCEQIEEKISEKSNNYTREKGIDNTATIARYVYYHAIENGYKDQQVERFINKIISDRELLERIEYEYSDELQESLKESLYFAKKKEEERILQDEYMKGRIAAVYKTGLQEKINEWKKKGFNELMLVIDDSVWFYQNVTDICHRETLKNEDLNLLDRKKLMYSSKIENEEDKKRIEILRKKIKEKTDEKRRNAIAQKKQEWQKKYPNNVNILKVLSTYRDKVGESIQIWTSEGKVCRLIKQAALDYGFSLYYYTDKRNNFVVKCLLDMYFPKVSPDNIIYNNPEIKKVFEEYKSAILYALEQFAYLGDYEIVQRILQIISLGYGEQEFADSFIALAKRNALEYAKDKDHQTLVDLIKSCMIQDLNLTKILEKAQENNSSYVENDDEVERYFDQKTRENLEREERERKRLEANITGKKRKRGNKDSDAGSKKKKKQKEDI